MRINGQFFFSLCFNGDISELTKHGRLEFISSPPSLLDQTRGATYEVFIAPLRNSQ